MKSDRPINVAHIVDLLIYQAGRSPGRPARGHRISSGKWRTETWRDWLMDIEQVARGLIGLGVEPGDRIAILAPTSPAWQTIEFAALQMGAVVVGIDPYLPPGQLAQQLALCRSHVLVTSTANEPSSNVLNACRQLKLRINIGDSLNRQIDPSVTTLDGLRRAGSHRRQPLPTVSTHDEATWVFTSGTTGDPKAICYTHGQMLQACRSILLTFPHAQPRESTLCWLPLAHLFQRVHNLVAIARGATIYFVEDPRAVIDVAAEVSPSVLVGVPRLFERLRDGILDRVEAMPDRKRRIVQAALDTAHRHGQLRRENVRPTWRLCLQRAIWDLLVLRRLRRVLGGRIDWMITGSAPLNPAVLEFFHDIGLPLFEAYGLTENVVPMAANTPAAFRLGSVGKPLPGNEIRLAADGEVLVRGPGVFFGYRHDTSREECFTVDGFFATGDRGRFDADGYLYLDGRKSDLIKTSTGHRITPLRLRTLYGQHPLIQHVIIIGNGRKYLTALFSIDFIRARRQFPVLRDETDAAISGNALIRAEIQRHMDVCAQSVAPKERIARFAVLPRPLGIDHGELTPTLKPRMAMIESHFAPLIESLYADGTPHLPVIEMRAGSIEAFR